MLGELSIDNLSWGKKISIKGAQDLLALFKNTMKNKYKKVLSAGSKEQH